MGADTYINLSKAFEATHEVNPLTKAIVLGLIALLLAAGCIQVPSGTPPSTQQPPAVTQTCRNVTTVTPVITEQCGNVSYTIPVCSLRKLNYSISLKPKVDLCIGDGVCNGQPLGQCQQCSSAMSRCVMIIKNNEPTQSGSWTVGANYTLGTAGFNKDPITATIDPNSTYEFDFYQIYTPGYPINSADCQLLVVKDPSIEDCHEETRARVDCANVTANSTSTTQVCE